MLFRSIGGILIRSLTSGKLSSTTDLLYFWKRRWFRTLPAYYLVLILNLLFLQMGWIDGKLEHFNWKFLFFLQNFNDGFTDFFWESWSLSIEEWFYIITPICFLLFNRFSNSRHTKFSTLAAILVILTGPLVYRFLISDISVDAFWFDVKFRKVVITRLDAIMFGVLFAWLKYYYSSWFQKIKWPGLIVGSLMLYFAKGNYAIDQAALFTKVWYFSLTGLGAALLLPAADSWKYAHGTAAKLVTHVSLISYSMYLINLGLVAQVIGKHFMPTTNTLSVATYFLYWFIVITGSHILYKFFEKPMTELRDKF